MQLLQLLSPTADGGSTAAYREPGICVEAPSSARVGDEEGDGGAEGDSCWRRSHAVGPHRRATRSHGAQAAPDLELM